MLKQITAAGTCALVAGTLALAPRTPAPTPADGHTIHVLAPHVVQGKVTGQFIVFDASSSSTPPASTSGSRRPSPRFPAD